MYCERVEYSTKWLSISLMTTEIDALDRVFTALGHPTRRQILIRLAEGEATVSALAEPFNTSLNAVSKHLKVLENAGLIQREVVGREHYCRLRPHALDEAARWIDYYRNFWATRLDAMEQELRARKTEASHD